MSIAEKEWPNSNTLNIWYTATNLEPGTTYYYQFYYISGGVVQWSEVKSFTTLSIPITGVSLDKTSITLKAVSYTHLDVYKRQELHIDKAVEVTNRVPISRKNTCYPHVASCDYFTVDCLNMDGKLMSSMKGSVNEDSFVSILIMEGEGTISCGRCV